MQWRAMGAKYIHSALRSKYAGAGPSASVFPTQSARREKQQARAQRNARSKKRKHRREQMGGERRGRRPHRLPPLRAPAPAAASMCSTCGIRVCLLHSLNHFPRHLNCASLFLIRNRQLCNRQLSLKHRTMNFDLVLCSPMSLAYRYRSYGNYDVVIACVGVRASVRARARVETRT
jgi:hypothetical protein